MVPLGANWSQRCFLKPRIRYIEQVLGVNTLALPLRELRLEPLFPEENVTPERTHRVDLYTNERNDTDTKDRQEKVFLNIDYT